jgi:thymidylate synthase
MGLIPEFIVATTLSDCWFQLVDLIVNKGRCWIIDDGSYAGQKRYELDYVTAHIKYPHDYPMIPEMPSHLRYIPDPTTMEYVEEYLPYLMTNQELKKNEVYTYGSRLESQIEEVVNKFRNHGYGTNQCTMTVAHPKDIELEDPPCLRSIDFRIFNDEGLKEGEERALHMIVHFRSNDLWNGFPINLASLAMMQQIMAQDIGVAAGEIIYSSKGLHIYDHVIKLAKLRVK